jgi:hypothetical protein
MISLRSTSQTTPMMRVLLMPDEPDKNQWRERNAVDELRRPRDVISVRLSLTDRNPDLRRSKPPVPELIPRQDPASTDSGGLINHYEVAA